MTARRALLFFLFAVAAGGARAQCPEEAVVGRFPAGSRARLLVVRVDSLDEDSAEAALREGIAAAVMVRGRKRPECVSLTEPLLRERPPRALGAAVLAFPAALRPDGLGPKTHLAAADAAGALGDRDAELWHAEQAALFDPRRADLWLRIGRLRLAAGRARQAEAAYRRALALDPGSVPAAEGRLVFGPDFRPRPAGPAVAEERRPR